MLLRYVPGGRGVRIISINAHAEVEVFSGSDISKIMVCVISTFLKGIPPITFLSFFYLLPSNSWGGGKRTQVFFPRAPPWWKHGEISYCLGLLQNSKASGKISVGRERWPAVSWRCWGFHGHERETSTRRRFLIPRTASAVEEVKQLP